MTELVREAKEAVQTPQSETDFDTDFQQLTQHGLREKKEASNREAQFLDGLSGSPSRGVVAALPPPGVAHSMCDQIYITCLRRLRRGYEWGSILTCWTFVNALVSVALLYSLFSV